MPTPLNQKEEEGGPHLQGQSTPIDRILAC